MKKTSEIKLISQIFFFLIFNFVFVNVVRGECRFINDEESIPTKWDNDIFVTCSEGEDENYSNDINQLNEDLKKFCTPDKNGKFYILKESCIDENIDQGCFGICGSTFICRENEANLLYSEEMKQICHCKTKGKGKETNDHIGLCKVGCITNDESLKTDNYNKEYYSSNKYHFYMCKCDSDNDCYDGEFCYNGACYSQIQKCANSICDLTKNVCHAIISNPGGNTVSEYENHSVCINKFCNEDDDCGKCQEINGCDMKDGRKIDRGSQIPLKYIAEIDKWACVNHVCVDLSCGGADHQVDENTEYSSRSCSFDKPSCVEPTSNIENNDGLTNFGVGSSVGNQESYDIRNFSGEPNGGDVGCQYCAFRKGRFCSELHRGYKCHANDNIVERKLSFSKGYQKDEVDILGFTSYGIEVKFPCIRSPRGMSIYIKFKCPNDNNEYLDDELNSNNSSKYPYFSSFWRGENYEGDEERQYGGVNAGGLAGNFPGYNLIGSESSLIDIDQTQQVNLYLDDFVRYIKLHADWKKYKTGCSDKTACDLYNDAKTYVECLKSCSEGSVCVSDEHCCKTDECRSKIDRELINIEEYIKKDSDCGLTFCDDNSSTTDCPLVSECTSCNITHNNENDLVF